MRSLTWEQWADVLTLGVLTVMWAVMLVLMIRRTWRWDGLGLALTVLVACLSVTYAFACLSIVLDADLWVPPLRWAVRSALLSSGLVTIVALLRDRPPAFDDRYNPRRRWSDRAS